MLIKDELEIISIEKLFKKKSLTIPKYQRPYRWTTNSAITLFNDIYSAYEANKANLQEYRIGTIIFHKTKESNYEIVDGQQRITTILVLLFCIKEVIGEKCFKEIINNLALDYGKLFVINYTELSYQSIVDNYKVLLRKCKVIKKELVSFAKYLLEKCTFVIIVTDELQEAFQFFDSQNNRGKEPAPPDLLKAYHLREMNDEDKEDKVKIINQWEDLNQDELKELFSVYLYSIIKWYKKENGLYFDKSKIGTFKGIKRNNNYNYGIYHKSSNWGIEQFNINNNNDLFNCNNDLFIDFQEKMCDILKLFKDEELKEHFNQFQLNQPIIDGKRFFFFILHYNNLLKIIQDKIIKFEDEHKEMYKNLFPTQKKGQIYVKRLYESVLMFFADRFSIDELDNNNVMNYFYTWCYSFYLIMDKIFVESINNYALGKENKNNEVNLKNAIPMFAKINEMKEPNEIDNIQLNKPNSNTGKEKEIIDFINDLNGWKESNA